MYFAGAQQTAAGAALASQHPQLYFNLIDSSLRCSGANSMNTAVIALDLILQGLHLQAAATPSSSTAAAEADMVEHSAAVVKQMQQLLSNPPANSALCPAVASLTKVWVGVLHAAAQSASAELLAAAAGVDSQHNAENKQQLQSHLRPESKHVLEGRHKRHPQMGWGQPWMTSYGCWRDCIT